MELQEVRTRKNLAKKIMLKHAHEIQKLQNRKEIDYGAIAFCAKLYVEKYEEYQKFLRLERELNA